MAIKETLLNVRNLKRNIKLRGEMDPTVVADALETILKEAVIAQASGSRTFQKKSLEEMRQIRNDLIVGNISAGQKSNQFTGLYSHLIDQIENISKDSKKSNAVFESTLGSFANSIPSADTFVSALMTANPLLGYGVKIVRDISRSRSEANRQRSAEAKKRLNVLKQEESFISDQLAKQVEEEKVLNAQKDVANKQKRSYTKGGIYKEVLESIRNEIVSLQRMIAKVDPSEEETINLLEASNDAQINSDEKLTKLQIDEMEELEEKRQRDRKLERVPEADSGIPKIEPVGAAAAAKKTGSIFDSIMIPFRALTAGLMTIGGVATTFLGAIAGFTGIKLLLGPLKWFLNLVVGLGKNALKFSRVLGAPLLIITSIFNFLDGFFNADEIIGRLDSEISIYERIKAGIANVAESILGLVDFVLELFGIDLFDSEGIATKLFNWSEEFEQSIIDGAKQIYADILAGIDTAFNFVESVANVAEELYDDLLQGVDTAFNKVKEVYQSIIDTFIESFEAIKNKLKGYVDTVKNSALGKLLGLGDETPEEKAEEEKQARKLAEDVKKVYGTENIVVIGGGFATMMDGSVDSGASANALAVRRAEFLRNQQDQLMAPVAINAPTTNTQVNNTSITGNKNTSNPDFSFRRAGGQ